jgi:dimethylglycine dehydrogenase
VTLAMAAAARIICWCRATKITQANTGDWLVETERGAIMCEHVGNAGGYATWAVIA